MQICSLLPTPIPLHSSFTPLWITSFGLQAPASSCLVWVLEISRHHRPGLVFHPKFCTRTPGSSKSHMNTTKTATFCPFLPFITPERSHYNWGSNKHVIEGITLPEGLQIPRDKRAELYPHGKTLCWAKILFNGSAGDIAASRFQGNEVCNSSTWRFKYAELHSLQNIKVHLKEHL